MRFSTMINSLNLYSIFLFLPTISFLSNTLYFSDFISFPTSFLAFLLLVVPRYFDLNFQIFLYSLLSSCHLFFFPYLYFFLFFFYVNFAMYVLSVLMSVVSLISLLPVSSVTCCLPYIFFFVILFALLSSYCVICCSYHHIRCGIVVIFIKKLWYPYRHVFTI